MNAAERKRILAPVLPALLLCLVVLGGCATAPRTPPPPSPVQPPQDLSSFQFARSFAGPGTVVEPVPTAVLLMSVGNHARNLKVCEAFLDLPTIDQMRALSPVDANLIITRMLLGTETPDEDRLGDCHYLLRIYDYARAQALMTKLGLGDSDGPIFVTLFPPDLASQGVPFIALDTAPLDDAQLDGFIGKWRETLGLASKQLVAVEQRIASDQPVAGSPLCDSVGSAVRATTPVLAAMGATALAAQYPAVVVVVSAFKEKDEGGVAVASINTSLGKLHDRVAEVAASGCSRVLRWLRDQLRGSGS